MLSTPDFIPGSFPSFPQQLLYSYGKPNGNNQTFIICVVRKTIFLYGLAIATLIIVLKTIEYRYLLRDLSVEIYIGAIALIFTAVGIWGGMRLTQRKKIIIKEAEGLFVLNQNELARLGISKREHEVLELMAQGFSNQEIADKLFVSLNTIKTHSANLFTKLDVKRRTQAVQYGKELKLIP